MTRTMLFALTASAAVAGTTYLYGQGSSVSLQPSTPGTQQVGNANVSGRVIAGSVQASDSSPTAQVIVGSATSTMGANFGGFFRSDSPLGRALYGRASALSGTTHGVWGQADSPGGRGVTGLAPAMTGNATGVWGQTASTTGRGVYGYSTSVGGVNYGVFGQSSSPQGFGVFSLGNMHATGVISGQALEVSGSATISGFVGIGPSSPSWPLHVVSNQLSLIRAEGTGTTGQTTTGYFSTASSAGNALYAVASSSTGSATGLRATSSAPNGHGVYGQATAGSGVTYGGIFKSLSPVGYGVYAETPGPYAVYGVGGNGGVRGEGYTYGVYAQSTNATGVGVLGYTTAETDRVNYGGRFMTESTFGRGVMGVTWGATGVSYGVRGESSSASGYGVYAVGDLGASGTKAFRIDHPFDPENKYLLHYAAESPMPQNFYVGNVVTDAKGYAWVELPDYFNEINTNFKYQLTVLDDADSDAFVQAKVSKKIKSNRFQIRTNAPNIEVSWEVKADRNDLYVRNRVPKEVVEKEGRERGTYQHPEFYGFGPERGINYDGDRQNAQNPPSTRKR